MPGRLKVLLVEPWFGGSHRAWAEGFQRHSNHNVTLLTLPAEAWRWRMRGGAITLADQVVERPDVVIASSLLDVAGFLGQTRGLLSNVPVVLYMHENQLTYPLPDGARRDMGLAFLNWSSMLAADRVVFNSEFHRAAWFDALPALLRSYPEPRHLDLVEDVAATSTVLPVGVEMGWMDDAVASKPKPPLVIWNQRWEHDKDPDSLAWGLGELAREAVEFRVAVCGEPGLGETPSSLAGLPEVLGPRLIHHGFAHRPTYEALLRDSSVVVSTAKHEFFGVAVVEAMAAGARPVLPNRLSYPGLVPPETHESVLYGNRAELVAMLCAALTRDDRGVVNHTTQASRQFDWRLVAPDYDELLASLP